MPSRRATDRVTAPISGDPTASYCSVLLDRVGEDCTPAELAAAYVALPEEVRATVSDTERRLLDELTWALERGAFRGDPAAGTVEALQWWGFAIRAASGRRYPAGRFVFRVEETPSGVGMTPAPTHIVAADVDEALRIFHEQFGPREHRDAECLSASAEHPAGSTTITFADPSDAPRGFIGLARRAGGELPFTFAELAALVVAGRMHPIVSSAWF